MVLPEGRVALLFTDIEGSTGLLRELGDDYVVVLDEHDRLMRSAFDRYGGVEVDNEGDAFFVAFADPDCAARAAAAIQRAIDQHAWPQAAPVRVRMALHLGEPRVRGHRYWGEDVHYAARLCSASHGGQILLSAAMAEALPTAEIRNLGSHGVKDFPAPLDLFHLVVDGSEPADFPPPRTLSTRRRSLPTPPAPIFGREETVAGVCKRLRGEERLVTLTGPGGIGKTRTALACAERLDYDFADGSAFVAMAVRNSPGDALVALAHELGVPRVDGADQLRVLAAHLADKQMLLVLDNLEHLPGMAPMLAELLEGTDRVRVLVTSQLPLRIRSEHVVVVPALELPPPGETDREGVCATASARMVLDRIAAQAPDWVLDDADVPHLAGLCRQLEGHPLALELAAARVTELGIREVQIDLLGAGPADLPQRQQGLDAALDWTVSLLDRESASLFRALSTFAQAWSLEDAEELFADHPVTLSTFELLARLADLSLVVVQGDGRFTMAEHVRRYAGARLESSGEGFRWRLAHAGLVATRLESIIPELDVDSRHVATLWSLMDDIARAVTWAAAHERELYRRLLAQSMFVLYQRGLLQPGFVDDFWEFVGERRDDEIQGWLMFQAGGMAGFEGDMSRSRVAYHEAAEWGDAHGLPILHMAALAAEAWDWDADRAERAMALARQGKAEAERVGHEGYAAFFEAIEVLPLIATGRYVEAEELLDRVMAGPGRLTGVGVTATSSRADIALGRGDYVRALSESAKGLREAGPEMFVNSLISVYSVAACLAQLHRDEESAELVAGLHQVHQSVMGSAFPFIQDIYEVPIEAMRVRLGAESRARAEVAAAALNYETLRTRALELAAL